MIDNDSEKCAEVKKYDEVGNKKVDFDFQTINPFRRKNIALLSL